MLILRQNFAFESKQHTNIGTFSSPDQIPGFRNVWDGIGDSLAGHDESSQPNMLSVGYLDELTRTTRRVLFNYTHYVYDVNDWC